ncbi:MAG: hypothetical protein U9Q83_09955, partial [Bacteroidota bacterium]|nr:hypothetical protein [Bacteroidota bacterium]
AFEIGKSVKATDGMTFEHTLVGIVLQESSAGKDLIGDKYEDKYYYKNWNKEEGIMENIFVKRKHTFIEEGNRYYRYKKHYLKKVYVLKGQLKSLYDSSLGAFQIKLSTAKIVIKKNLPDYHYLLEDEDLLVKKLLANIKFSAVVAANYLKLMYEEAQRRKKRNPWFKAISRYNGGQNNETYFKLVNKRIRFFKRTRVYKELKRGM